ncbi:MAG: FAD-binding protein, partial [Balneolaceae bacterium]
MNPDPTGTTSKEPVVRENVHLRPFNTLGVEATADYFAAVETAGQLFRLYRENLLEQDLWILGGGSNVLFAGRVHALVLKNEIDFRELLREDEDHVLLKAGGGSDWHGLVTCCVEKGWGGIENLALIPGTAGAAPVQNIGAYGAELSDCFIALEAFDLREGRLRTFSHEECRFGYRDSIFKKDFK